jgi:hypothetical protein
VEKEKGRPTINMAVGTAVHAAIELMLSMQRDSGELIEEVELVEAAQDSFGKEAAEGFVAPASDFDDGGDTSDVLNAAQSKVQRLVAYGRKVFGSEYREPTLIEHEFRLILPGDYDMVGIIDLIDARGVVVDFKTGTRNKPQTEADTSLALTLYAIAHKLIVGSSAAEIRLETLVDGSKGPTSQMLRTYRDDDSYRVLSRRVRAAETLIKSGSFPPAPASAWWCTAKMCEYHSTCKYAMKPAAGTMVELTNPRSSGVKMPDGIDAVQWLSESPQQSMAEARRSQIQELLLERAACHFCDRALTTKSATLATDKIEVVLSCPSCNMMRRAIPDAIEE